MSKAISHIFWAITGILLCWIPLLVAVKDSLCDGPMRAPLKTCIAREWARWWSVYDEQRGAS